MEVTNSAGQTASQPFAIAVGTTATLPAPSITSQPGLSAVENQPYTYQITAYDANLGTGSFSYSVTGPGGATLPNASINSTGSLAWTPGAVGPQSITIIVTDDNGSATQTFTVNVTAPTAAPVISPIPSLTVTAGNLLSYNDNTSFLATGDSIASWSFADPSSVPPALTITDVNGIGQIRWQTSVSTPIGSYSVGVLVTDIYGQSSQSNFTITVAADSAPTIQIAAITPTANGAANTYDQNTSVTIAVTATDVVGVAGMTLTLDGNPVTLTTVNPGYATAVIYTGTAGTALNLSATATNFAGLTSQPATLSLTSINPTVTTAPTLAITGTGPSDTPISNDDPTQPNFNPTPITAPTVIDGTVIDSNLTSWTLSYAPIAANGTGSFTTLATGTTSTAQTNTALGTFDPTLLQNGQYVIQLTATNTGGLSSSSQIYVAVLGQEKIGNFQFSQTDVTIPVAGLPIQLTRNYNSLDRNTYSDLGYGWTLGTNFNIQEDPSQYSTYYTNAAYSNSSNSQPIQIRTGGDRNVWITLPNGQRTEFEFYIADTPTGLQGAFKAVDPTVHYTLAIDGNAGITDNTTLGVEYWSALGLTEGEDPLTGANDVNLMAMYQIPGYTLTAPDGTKFYFEKTQSSGEVFFNQSYTNAQESDVYDYLPALYNNNLSLTKIVDANGNTIGITSTGYSYTSPITGQTVNELSFVRDTAGRITAVNNAAGQTLVTYTYDQNGDLTQSSVLQTPAVTNSNGNIITPAVWDVTNYTYLQGPQAHIINKITSPSGSTPIINQYDSSGRLISSTDSNGNTITYNPNIAGNQEVVTDRNGNQTVYVYDNQGRVVDQTDPQGHETIYVYGYSWTNNPTTVTTDTLVNGVATNVLTKTYTYDLNGNQLSETYTIPAAGNDPQQTVATYSTYTTIAGRQLLLTSTDANGTVTTNSYDPNTGNLIETDVTDSAGNLLSKTTFGNYNAQGLAGTITQYDDINAAGQLTPGIFTPYSITTMTYDAPGNVVVAGGYLTETDVYTYDASASNGLGTLLRKSTFYYDGSGNQIGSITWNTSAPASYPTGVTPPTNVTVTNADGTQTTWYPYAITQSIYDSQNRLIESIDPQGNKTYTLYNLNGQVSQTIDARGVITQYNYDLQGQQSSVIYALGTPQQTVTSTTYDANGNVLTQTDQAGNVTKYVYNSINQVTSTTTAYGTADAATTYTSYNAQGQVATQTDADGNVTSYVYDLAGREISFSVTSNPSPVASYTYNAAGQQASMTDANGHTTQYVYNALGHQIETIYPDGTTSKVAYDALGRKVSETDQNGNITTYTYDQLGELLTVTGPAVTDGNPNSPTYGTSVSPVTTYAYDAVGNQISQTDANGNTTKYSYDVMGRKISRTLPMGQTESWTYDANGNMLTHTDFNGHTTTYTYNALNQLVTQTPDAYFTGEAPVSYTYTPDGQIATMTDGTGTTTYTYDHRNDLVEVQSPEGTLYYTYDSQGNETSVHSADANGINETYTYDSQNRLSTAVDSNLPTGANTTTYLYDLVGNIASVTEPNGVVTTYTYNSLNRLTDEVVKNAGGTTLASYSYTLDNAGNRTGVTERQLLPNGTVNTRTVAYQYDNLYRLLFETIGGDSQGGNGTISYAYDLVGNRMSRTSNVAGVSTSTSTYNANDELTSEIDNGVTTNYSYDANGNTTETSNGTTTTTFTYDSQNRLIKQNAGQSNEVDITYDGAGNKVAETVNGVTTIYLVDSNNPTGYSQIVEEIVNGAVTRRYTIGHWIISETQNISGTWTTSFYGYDGHNSVRFLTNANGVVTDNYTFDAFGIKIAGTGATSNQILYSGEFLDPGTGNYDMGDREYRQNTGSFLTADTTPGQLPYVYTADNPVMMVDPSGNAGIMDSLAAISILSTLSGAIGGVAGAAQYHSVRGFVGGFWGSLIGTETSLLLFVDTPFFAPFGPAGAAAAFGIGSALGTATDIIIREGSFDAVRTQSSIIEIAASLLVGMLAGGTGSLESVFAQKEMAEQIGSMPAVKAVLGQIVNKTGVLPKAVAESGLTNSFFTLARLYAPEFANLAKEILISGGIDKIEEAAILPVVQFVVTAVGGAISDPMGGGA